MTLTSKQLQFVAAARAAKNVPPTETLTLGREEIISIAQAAGLKEPQWLTNHATYRVGRGQYSIPNLTGKAAKAAGRPAKPAKASAPTPAAPPSPVAPAASNGLPSASPEAMALMSLSPTGTNSLVPKKMATYVPFGAHAKALAFVKSGRWVPTYITGLSGNGKTTTIEQVCAEAGREFVRVNITSSTDEDDLMGGLRLINGETVWVDGPVVVAMKRGAVLLLDEVDLATDGKTMCLQGVLEGKPVFIKKTCTWVHPAPGFTVFATGNTKGRGDETGRFIGTSPMNEANLDRYAEMIPQEYPPKAVETKILMNVMKSNGVVDETFATLLVNWADQNRRAYADGAIEDVITTRRLIHTVNLFSIYNNRVESVAGVLSRFDVTTRQAMLDLYKKLDAAAEGGENKEPLGEAPKAAPVTTPASNAPPF